MRYGAQGLRGAEGFDFDVRNDDEAGARTGNVGVDCDAAAHVFLEAAEEPGEGKRLFGPGEAGLSISAWQWREEISIGIPRSSQEATAPADSPKKGEGVIACSRDWSIAGDCIKSAIDHSPVLSQRGSSMANYFLAVDTVVAAVLVVRELWECPTAAFRYSNPMSPSNTSKGLSLGSLQDCMLGATP